MARIDRRRLLVLGGGVALSGGMPAGKGDSVIASTPSGALRGVRTGEVVVWRGIRYAEPPRRFAAPVPARPWRGVRDAGAFGPAAVQANMGQPERPNQSEDCLFLNVYSTSTTGRRPVIVWIHGGAFVMGAGSDYDGTAYAARGDVVLVTINYRLGAFGYLYQPELPGSGNLALLDQVAALRWVRSHISAFGGDPGNVTVMGESAGGMSIGALLGMPAARGLFRRAVVQSGGVRPVFTARDAAATTSAMLRELGLREDQSAMLARVPVAEFAAVASAVAVDPELGGERFHPVLDGEVLPRHPITALARDVDVMVGTCRDEANELAKVLPAFGTGLPKAMRAVLGDERWSRLRQAYRLHTPSTRDWEMDLLSGAFVVMPSVWLAETTRAWNYRFDYADASKAGPAHAADIPFTFGRVDERSLAPGADVAAARALANTMLDAFSAFAHGRDPGWPRERTMLFDTPCGLAENRLEAELRAAWNGVDPALF
ncbi:carboxylesterase/lipase family protein [Allokutzneria albata]|uniref:Carboxylic ester hydrolase n=1 Tax=Allokutzneria albata TaxID=211114 RepID=A0A1G9VS06_ALLAB|nr:carboxylesterase family protein [Allokutzneria albata]SDM74846.1 para-nitrobenzyl esterase [Allokutzneria albata]